MKTLTTNKELHSGHKWFKTLQLAISMALTIVISSTKGACLIDTLKAKHPNILAWWFLNILPQLAKLDETLATSSMLHLTQPIMGWCQETCLIEGAFLGWQTTLKVFNFVGFVHYGGHGVARDISHQLDMRWCNHNDSLILTLISINMYHMKYCINWYTIVLI